MKTLNWYVTRGFLLAFFMAIGILTFGMTGANLVKVLDYVSKGASVMTFVKFTCYILPIILTMTIPWAVMVAVMLVFGRLSADSEITAMRACGVSILQIVSPILIITFLLTLFCLYLQVELGPPWQGKARALLKDAAIDQPMAIFEPGKPIEYEKSMIYIDDKKGEDTLVGVQIYTLSSPTTVAQDITAERGKLSVDKEKQQLVVSLEDCLVVNKQETADKDKPKTGADDPLGDIDSDGPLRFYAKNLEFRFYYGEQANAKILTERAKYMRLGDLMARIRFTKELKRDTTDLEVELNSRIAFALSPIAFLLLGLPLAIRTSRRETSVGLFLSVILAGLFFMLVILCDSFTSHPNWYPQYLLWLPNILFQVVGAVMTYRISQR